MTIDWGAIRREFIQAVVEADVDAMEIGYLGRHSGGMTDIVTHNVRGKPGYRYVTRKKQTVIEAIDKANSPYIDDYPVEFRYENGDYVICGKSVHSSVPVTPPITVPTDTDDLPEGVTNLYLTQERVEDYVAAMFALGSHLGIAFSYNDGTGAFSADAQTAGDARYAPIAKGVTNGDSHDHSGGDGAQIAYASLSGLPTVYTQEQIEDFVGAMATDSSSVDFTYNDGSGTFTAAVIDEYIQDLVGLMFSGNTETGVTVTYQDSDGTIDVVLDNEYVQDLVGAMLLDGNGIDLSYNDTTGQVSAALTTLTSNWDIGEDRRILAEAFAARDVEGLSIFDDGGNLIAFFADGGGVGVGTSTINSNALVHIDKSVNTPVSIFVSNANAGSSAQAGFRGGLDPTNFAIDYISMSVLGAGFGTVGVLKAGSALVEGNSSNMVISSLSASEPLIIATGASRAGRVWVLPTGEVGINVSSPLGRLHGYNNGGFCHFSSTNVGAAVTLIPNAAGDVTKGVYLIGCVYHSGATLAVGQLIFNGGSANFNDGGGNVLQLAVAANGTLTATRTTGSATWGFSLFGAWF